MSSEAAGKLIILSGPSGVGKTTVARPLLAIPGFRRVVTATTRAPRPGEVNGRDYHFLSAAEFEKWIQAGQLIEHARVHGHWYGTPRQAVEEGLARGDWILLIIDVQGARQVRERGRDLPLTTIFLLPPSFEALEERLEERGTEAPEAVQKRLETARRELEEQRFYDHVVVNDRVDRAVEEILRFIGRPLAPQAVKNQPKKLK